MITTLVLIEIVIKLFNQQFMKYYKIEKKNNESLIIVKQKKAYSVKNILKELIIPKKIKKSNLRHVPHIKKLQTISVSAILS